MTADGLRLRACAKLNWCLEVLGSRSDGYHEVRTILQTLALWDDVELWPTMRAVFAVEAPEDWSVPADAQNLAARAAALYAARSHTVGEQTSIRLHKRVPPAAGLGGGSSDAAAVLRGLDLLAPAPQGTWGLQALGAELGSDVPFFVQGGTQLAAGRGELLTVLPDAPLTWLVLVTPPLVAERKTARLYGLLRSDDFSDGSRVAALADALAAGAAIEPPVLVNTFDRVAEAAFTGLTAYRRALVERCGHAVLCGAGPSLFALAASEHAATSTARDLRAHGIPAQPVCTAGTVDCLAVERVDQAAPHDIMKKRARG